ncbi:CoA-acylating methylmalonate-semialdehyde dehydrogenase [Pectinatus brassicae]|uniref:Malonate-semialdehyde dehydrogenase (Acetylating)/methylmalonate-semialdehyde dehydrogenase n=1 Tax=Pectinatus brassicae TaxID=862415 RepID=A0A840UE48_9FIRM|nr:CoA-acylating methylmalonate-semialdehyde dehydrogenase [Pectinatus brassicae]MBB5335386.1 malonate-semialdehyde dehydrogenase (acetylating)/methylmalonate-semialdehyde dehydrogenase [Pectinatus brassicae]
MAIKKLQYFVNGTFKDSKSTKIVNVYDPSTGSIIAEMPCCTEDEVNEAVAAAKNAFKSWSTTAPSKRAAIMFKVKELLDTHLDELTMMVAKENGKCWEEAKGDVLKAIEPTELACGIPSLLASEGEALFDASRGYDTIRYREPLGVFAGIAPFNFPAMIPMGWMTPMCIACGNTIVLKVSSNTPMTSLRIAELYKEAGVPDGVVNIVPCTRNEAEMLLSHPDIKGITFVGTTTVGLHIYSEAAKTGKRVQALCEAKNHALILEDAPIDRTAASIINASYGCAGERCMALPVIVVQDSIADKLVAAIVDQAKNMKIGPAYDKNSKLGPVIDDKHRQRIIAWIEKGISEGAKLVLDGRNIIVDGYENGFYLGPTILDHVTSDMTVGQREIFGPVLCIKRCKDFEDGLNMMNANPFANGSAIFTQNGHYAREFARRTDGGMVGINVGIPVPIGMFPFNGHKQSFFGDLHCLGRDGVRFYTESKVVTSRWFDEEAKKEKEVSTWDGTI